MNFIKNISGFFLVLVGLIVMIHTIAEPVYYNSTADSVYSPAWDYINFTIAISLILGILFSNSRLRQVTHDTDVKEFVASNVLFYGFIVLSILFYTNWLGMGSLASDYNAITPTARGVTWLIFDSVFPCFSVALGGSILKNC